METEGNLDAAKYEPGDNNFASLPDRILQTSASAGFRRSSEADDFKTRQQGLQNDKRFFQLTKGGMLLSQISDTDSFKSGMKPTSDPSDSLQTEPGTGSYLGSWEMDISIAQRWHEIGQQEGLHCIADIATFLINMYERTLKYDRGKLDCCPKCQSNLVLHCATCGYQHEIKESQSNGNVKLIQQPEVQEKTCSEEMDLPNLNETCRQMESEEKGMASSFTNEIANDTQSNNSKKLSLSGSEALENQNALVLGPGIMPGGQDTTCNSSNASKTFLFVKDMHRNIQSYVCPKRSLCSKPSDFAPPEGCTVAASTIKQHATNSASFQQSVDTHGKTAEIRSGCDACNETLIDGQDQDKHARLHFDQNLFLCCECGTAFMKDRALKIHMRSHAPAKTLQCLECSSSFSSSLLFKKHMQNVHVDAKPFQCKMCDSTFTTSSHLKVHVRSHTGDKPYKCKECGQACAQSGELVRHMLTHTGEKPFHCNMCSSTFTRASYLTVHMRNHHTGHKPFKCQHCGMAYADPRNLKVHLRKHSGEKPFLCQDCGKSFADPSVLARHRRQHTGAKPYRCDQCNVSFTNSGSLKYHARRHMGLKPYLCDECGAAFTSSSQLSQHRRMHTGIKPFSCQECGASFARSQNLKAHLLNHSGQKPQRRMKRYTCEYCSVVFTDNRNFVRHVRIHTGEKPFKCSDCEAAFAQPGDLKKHVRVHTGEKPYTCPECASTFRHSSGLTIHRRTHTGEKPYKCQHCESAFISSSKLTSHVRSRHKQTSARV